MKIHDNQTACFIKKRSKPTLRKSSLNILIIILFLESSSNVMILLNGILIVPVIGGCYIIIQIIYKVRYSIIMASELRYRRSCFR